MHRGQRLTLPVTKYVQLGGVLQLVAPHTHRDPGSEQWPFCRICCHRNRACSGRWAPQQPPGTGRRFGNRIGRRGWSAARSLVAGSHRRAR